LAHFLIDILPTPLMKKIAQIGNVELTAKTEKTVELSPILAGVSLATGIILVLIGMRKP